LVLATASGIFSGAGALTSVAACCLVPEFACAARRARDRDPDRPTPQECAIEGPAVYPITAPATAPTGPSTTAPDTAPKAASPARFCALASNGVNDAATSATTSSFFIAVPLHASPKATGLRNCGGTKVMMPAGRVKRAPDKKVRPSPRFKKAGGRFPARAQFLRR
jgi:hypothetical protein